MSTFYFSGVEKGATAKILQATGASGMMSQLLYSSALMDACTDVPLVLDSGAYSIRLDSREIEKYAALICKLEDRCIWYAAPDCIGDQERSNANYNFLLSLLPESLHGRILWIYQYGSNLTYLHAGLEEHQRIGIGGLVPLLRGDKQHVKQVVLSLARIVQQYRRVPHYFGLSTPSVLSELNTIHADYSVDSTTWLAGGKYGLLIDAQGRQHPAYEGGYDFSTSAILEQNVRTMRKWVERPATKKSKGEVRQMSFLDEERIA